MIRFFYVLELHIIALYEDHGILTLQCYTSINNKTGALWYSESEALLEKD